MWGSSSEKTCNEASAFSVTPEYHFFVKHGFHPSHCQSIGLIFIYDDEVFTGNEPIHRHARSWRGYDCSCARQGEVFPVEAQAVDPFPWHILGPFCSSLTYNWTPQHLNSRSIGQRPVNSKWILQSWMIKVRVTGSIFLTLTDIGNGVLLSSHKSKFGPRQPLLGSIFAFAVWTGNVGWHTMHSIPPWSPAHPRFHPSNVAYSPVMSQWSRHLIWMKHLIVVCLYARANNQNLFQGRSTVHVLIY